MLTVLVESVCAPHQILTLVVYWGDEGFQLTWASLEGWNNKLWARNFGPQLLDSSYLPPLFHRRRTLMFHVLLSTYKLLLTHKHHSINKEVNPQPETGPWIESCEVVSMWERSFTVNMNLRHGVWNHLPRSNVRSIRIISQRKVGNQPSTTIFKLDTIVD